MLFSAFLLGCIFCLRANAFDNSRYDNARPLLLFFQRILLILQFMFRLRCKVTPAPERIEIDGGLADIGAKIATARLTGNFN
jgi:hypothetical protein